MRIINPSLMTNTMKTKKKKKEREDIKMSQYRYFDSLDCASNPIELNKVKEEYP